MAEIYCKNCGKPISSTLHKVGGPECVSLQEAPPSEEKEPSKNKLDLERRRINLARQGIPYKKTLD